MSLGLGSGGFSRGGADAWEAARTIADDATLLKWRTAVSKLTSDGYRPLVIDCGDSITAGAGAGTSANGSGVYTGGSFLRSQPYYFAQRLAARAIPSNFNCWFGVHGYNTNAEFNTVDARFQVGANINIQGYTSLGGNQFNLAVGDATNRITITPTGAVDRVTLVYSKNAGLGTVVVADGGVDVATTIDTSGANSVGRTTIDLVSRAAGKTLTVRATGAQVFIIGFIVWDSTIPAVDVINAGIYGYRADEAAIAVQPYDYANVLDFMNPDLAFLRYGGNDANYAAVQGSTVAAAVATYRGAMQTLIDKASPSGSVVLRIPLPCASGAIADTYYGPIRAAIPQLATLNNLTLIDNFSRMGDYATALADGRMRDGTHGGAPGYADLAVQDEISVLR